MVCFTALIVLYCDCVRRTDLIVLFSLFNVSGWSLKQKSKFSKSSPVIMLGRSYELKDQGEALSSGPFV